MEESIINQPLPDFESFLLGNNLLDQAKSYPELWQTNIEKLRSIFNKLQTVEGGEEFREWLELSFIVIKYGHRFEELYDYVHKIPEGIKKRIFKDKIEKLIESIKGSMINKVGQEAANRLYLHDWTCYFTSAVGIAILFIPLLEMIHTELVKLLPKLNLSENIETLIAGLKNQGKSLISSMLFFVIFYYFDRIKYDLISSGESSGKEEILINPPQEILKVLETMFKRSTPFMHGIEGLLIFLDAPAQLFYVLKTNLIVYQNWSSPNNNKRFANWENSPVHPDYNSKELMLYAVFFLNIEAAKILLESGFNPNSLSKVPIEDLQRSSSPIAKVRKQQPQPGESGFFSSRVIDVDSSLPPISPLAALLIDAPISEHPDLHTILFQTPDELVEHFFPGALERTQKVYTQQPTEVQEKIKELVKLLITHGAKIDPFNVLREGAEQKLHQILKATLHKLAPENTMELGSESTDPNNPGRSSDDPDKEGYITRPN